MSPLQRYVSNELFHFVGRTLADEDDQYRLLVEILSSGWLTHPPHNPNISGNLSVDPDARISENAMFNAQVVCFCDVPVGDLEIHVAKYSPFGLSFLKSFLVRKGANPVFYVAKNSMVADYESMVEELTAVATDEAKFDDLVKRSKEFTKDIRKRIKEGLLLNPIPRAEYFDKMTKVYQEWFNLLKEKFIEEMKEGAEAGANGLSGGDWRKQMEESRKAFEQANASRNMRQSVERFLDFYVFSFVKVFDDVASEEDPANFYMEREWRMLGNLHFDLNDVHRVVIPEAFGKRFRNDLPGYFGQVHSV